MLFLANLFTSTEKITQNNPKKLNLTQIYCNTQYNHKKTNLTNRQLLGLFMRVHCTVHNCCTQYCTEKTW